LGKEGGGRYGAGKGPAPVGWGDPGANTPRGALDSARRKVWLSCLRGFGDALAKMSATAAPMKPKNGAEAGQRSDDMVKGLHKFANAEGSVGPC